MNRRHLIRAAAAACLFTVGAQAPALAQAPTLQTMKPVKLRVATLFGPESYLSARMKDFTDRIESRTNKKVTFEYFYAGSLVPAKDLAKGLGQGLYDFGMYLGAYEPTLLKVDLWQARLAIPYQTNPVRETMLNALANYEWTSKLEAHSREIKSNNIQPIISSLSLTGPFGILCKQDNSTLASMAGKRVRVGGEVWAGEVTNLGGTPVTLPVTETYQAFQSGLIDCWVGGTHDAGPLGLFDHGKFYNVAGLTSYTQSTYGFNMDVWKAFPKEVKEIIWDETAEYAVSQLKGVMELQISVAKSSVAKGVRYVVPDAAMAKKIDSYHTLVRARALSSAPPSVSNPAAAVASLQETKERWNKILIQAGFAGDYKSWVDFVEKTGGKLPDLEPVKKQINANIVNALRASEK